MLYQDEQGVYLFGYDTLEDAGCVWDMWFETAAAAESEAQTSYQVAPDTWQTIADPLPDCQHDWISPVRVVGRSIGHPQRGQLETLRNGQWVPILLTS